MSGKKKDYINWEEYFMLTAILTGNRSKDPSTQVGACIVDNQNRIIGVGYNGFPKGCSDDVFPWGKEGHQLDQKYMYVVHAEMNAILNKNVADMKGSKMYVSLFPCNECAKLIIQSGVAEIIYISDKDQHKNHTIAAKRMFDAAGVTYRQYIPDKSGFYLDYNIRKKQNANLECKSNQSLLVYPFFFLLPIFIFKSLFCR